MLLAGGRVPTADATLMTSNNRVLTAAEILIIFGIDLPERAGVAGASGCFRSPSTSSEMQECLRKCAQLDSDDWEETSQVRLLVDWIVCMTHVESPANEPGHSDIRNQFVERPTEAKRNGVLTAVRMCPPPPPNESGVIVVSHTPRQEILAAPVFALSKYPPLSKLS
jgi:hypothetical protein